MKCRNCNAELEPDARFCEVCGTPTQAEPIRTTYKPSRIVIGKRKASARNIAVGVITIALIVAAVCVAIMVLNMRGLTSSADSSKSAEAVSSSSSSAAAEEESSSSASSAESEESSSASAVPTFDNVAAELQARKDATAAGMQVFSGTLHITTFAKRAEEINPRYVNSVWEVGNNELALIVFTIPETVSAYGSQGIIETRNGQESISLANLDKWREFDGQTVTIAAYPDDLVFPSDLNGALYSAAGGAVLIAPLTEARANELVFTRQGGPDFLPELKKPEKETKSSKSSEKKEQESKSSAAQSGGDYILPDSSSRLYTASELSKFSDYELFIARNEIYARYGREFQSSDLQSYFESKGWYHGTTSAGEFNESILSDVELAKAATIRSVEESRDSKYL